MKNYEIAKTPQGAWRVVCHTCRDWDDRVTWESCWKWLSIHHHSKWHPKPQIADKGVQCNRRDVHYSHYYQLNFGDYLDTYCPGNKGVRR